MKEPISNRHQVVKNNDAKLLKSILTEETVFYPPIIFKPQKDRKIVMTYLFSPSKMFAGTDFHYVKELISEQEAVLEFNAEIDTVKIDGVYNSELIALYDIFQHTIFHMEGGINVFTVNETTDTMTTFEGLKLIPHVSFDSPDLPEIDILVVPSAEHNMDSDLENEQLIRWVAEIGSKADYVMGLCDGAFVLAKARLVDGKESTTFPTDIEKYCKTFSQLSVHENVTFVHHDKLLTPARDAKSYDVALYLVHHLYGDEVAKGIGRGWVIDWDMNDYEFLRVE